MRVGVIGAGAVGQGLASALGSDPRRAADPLVLVVRDARTRASLAEDGLRRSGRFGEVRVPPERLELRADAGELGEGRLDATLLCHKGPDTEALAAQVGALPESALGRLILCQNGWGHAEVLARHVRPARIHNAVVITGFHRRTPAHVEVTAHAAPIRMGGRFGADSEGLAPLCAAIARGGLPCETVVDVEAVLWGKVLYNALLNPLGALVGAPYGELAASAAGRAVMAAVAREVFAVLERRGTRLPWPDAEGYLRHFHRDLLPPTARHESSMLQDLRAGRATEIESLSGALAALGRELGVETPVNEALATLVRAAEAQRPRKRGDRFSRKARTPSA